MAAIWELTGREGKKKKKKEGRNPAEDESNNSDMTLPKANLAPLNDDVSRFSAPHCAAAAACGEGEVITLP